MPKDPTKNIFQYKIRGGHLNEFEFHKNQGAVTEQKERPWESQNFDPNAKTPDTAVETERKAGKGAVGKQGESATSSARKQPAKVARKAPKKAAKKKSAKTTSKSAAKKATSRKASTTRRAKKASGPKKASTTRRRAKK